ncbi:MAG: T9SS type A sorting domain-containing protein [Fidelibacterota bacterium]|nr:MAG: T9SS type A sorting domain-containing protein [Candidatus Neomarinimicrobiota bacterium]
MMAPLLIGGLGDLNAQAWQSEIVYYDSDEKLVYEADEEGNRIPDFSYAGYSNGNDPIPNVPVVETISPIDGDNTQHINNALFQLVLSYPVGADGFRGALLLTPGTYEIRGTINLGFDGVVLRGSGDGESPDSNTILLATGNEPNQRTVLEAGGGAVTHWGDSVSGTTVAITSDSVLVGERSFTVADARPFAVGDNIIIYHPCTAAWLAAIDSGGTHSDLGGAEPGVDVPWTVGSQPISFNRYITGIAGDTITVDVPVYNHLVRSLSPSYIYTYSRGSLRSRIGIEDLRIRILADGTGNEDHAWNAIDLFLIEDAWVRNCTMSGFGLSGVRTGTATRVTVEDCRAIEPISIIDGGRRYNFQVYRASQQILFKDCHASEGRHHYMSNGTSSTSGIVFVDCTSQGAYASSEGHRRWSTGLLYDNLVELDGPRPGYNPRLLGLYNRGYYGTSHGWSAAHSVAWACDVHDGDLIVQKPPTAQNYAIGCFGGQITGEAPPASFDEPEGYIEGPNTQGLHPRSLYYAQLEERLGGIAGVADAERNRSPIPEGLTLHQNYPNPFNGMTSLRFDLVVAANIGVVVHDVCGRMVAELAEGWMDAGAHTVAWDGRTSRGEEMPSGIYIVRLSTENFSRSVKMILLK